MRSQKVLFVAGELTPLAKVGGLGDVIGALPKSLIKKGIDVRIAIPKYGIVDEKKYGLKKVAENIEVPFNGEKETINIYQCLLPGSTVPVYFLDNLKYLGGGGVYFEKDASSGGSSRECQRFTFFARAVFEIFEKLNFWPDIIHGHDWHVGLVPFLLKQMAKKDKRFKKIKTLLTIHNFAYQGKYNYDEAATYLNLKKDESLEKNLPHFDHQTINYLQQAVAYADLINTVSPTYAKEILTPAYGEGLDKFLAKRKKDLSGIVNGIDTEVFDPQTDHNLIRNYSLNDSAGKMENKKDLQKIAGLAINENLPVFGLVGRLTEQKGVDLLAPILSNLVEKNCQFVILGAGLTEYEQIAKKMAADFPDHVFVKIGFDASLAQKIYAGADFFLMPSRFEPCGLGQMIAMRYGTIPIVRATGGLSDTVEEFETKTGQGTGFRFNNFKAEEFLAALEKSLEIFQNKESWWKLTENAMRQNFSWDQSCGQYQKLYQKLK